MGKKYGILNMAMMDAAIVCWDAKYVYFNPRPPQMNNTIKTVTGFTKLSILYIRSLNI
jgi:hypothetical protein